MFIIKWEICSIITTNIILDIMLEWRGIIYSSIVLFISRIVLKFSMNYIENDLNKQRFTYIILLFIISINMLILIPNIISILIGWDGLGITSFILIIYYNNSRSLRAGILTIIINRLGDAFLLMAIIRTIDLGDWLFSFNPKINTYFFIQWSGIIVAAITKRAQIPYSSWLPAAIAAPTPVSALVHSSTLVTAGVFILYRFNNIINYSPLIQSILILSGMLTILIARIRAIYENDIKKIIALSTLRQLGLIVICIRINIPKLTFFHMSTHAIFKALLFIAAGCIISVNNHNQDLRLYGKFYTTSPVISSSILISCIALTSIPFIAGYYSKHTIIEWSHYNYLNIFIYLLILLRILLTLLYSLRLIIFILMLPSLQTPYKIHYSYNNYNTPLILISITRIFIGAITQWVLPIKLTAPPILNSSNIIIFLMIRTLIIISVLGIKYRTNIIPVLNKIFSSLIFINYITTQFSLPVWFKISINIYKYLDQSWLEKIISIQVPISTLKARLAIDLLHMKLQKLLIIIVFTITIFSIFLLITC